MRDIEEHPGAQKLIDFLLVNRPISEEVFKLNKVERRKHFISKMFNVYNGFRFTPKSISDNVSLISPISIVNHMANLMDDSDAHPYDFDQYCNWPNIND